MENTYQTIRKTVRNVALVGLAALALGGCSNKFDKAIKIQKQREWARQYTGQVMQDGGYKVYGQRNGARVATKDYENGSVTNIDANGNGYFEKTLTTGFGQEPRIEVDSNDGAIFGFPK